jgi:hypothetical protein
MTVKFADGFTYSDFTTLNNNLSVLLNLTRLVDSANGLNVNQSDKGIPPLSLEALTQILTQVPDADRRKMGQSKRRDKEGGYEGGGIRSMGIHSTKSKR